MSIQSIKPMGDSALLVSLGDQIDLQINRQVHALAGVLTAQTGNGLGECIPAYAGLLVHYDPLALDFPGAAGLVKILAQQISGLSEWVPNIVEIPVAYGGEYGPDLGFVAQHAGLSADEVIRRHSAGAYPVYMMGFTPGFPYLGGMDPRLAAPRLDTPRSRVPAGSVGIAGEQTGIYPLESPGGWRIIGRTPLRLFDLETNPVCLLSPGDEVHFIPLEQK